MKGVFLLAVLLCTLYARSQTTWVVSNSQDFPAHFPDLQEAINSSKVQRGDILLVQGSTINYGDIVVDKKVIIMGPGYFLLQNPNTQVNKQDARINTVQFVAGSEESVMQGVSIVGSKPRYANIGYGWCRSANDLGSYGVEIKTSKIAIRSCAVTSNLFIYKASFTQIAQCYLGGVATDSAYAGNVFLNNIIATGVQVTGCVFSNNFIYGNGGFYHFFVDCTLERNIVGAGYGDYVCSGWRISITGKTSKNIFPWEVSSDSPDFGVPDFSKEYLNQGSADGRFQMKPNSVSAIHGIGPFAGANPYKLSGISMHPNIYSVTMPATAISGSGLKIEVKVKAND